jgi:hypothetical protein
VTTSVGAATIVRTVVIRAVTRERRARSDRNAATGPIDRNGATAPNGPTERCAQIVRRAAEDE